MTLLTRSGVLAFAAALSYACDTPCFLSPPSPTETAAATLSRPWIAETNAQNRTHRPRSSRALLQDDGATRRGDSR